jgi:hypothetical protein
VRISPELLARAHGALSVAKDNGPCAGVLRELVEAVEDATPPQGSRVFVVPPNHFPALMYACADTTVVLTTPTLDLQRAVGLLQLRILAVVLAHVDAQVDAAIEALAD